MTTEAQNLLVEGIKWLVGIVAEAAKGEPAPTQAELEARVKAALSARDREWLPAALDHADGVYDGGTTP